MAPLSTSGAAAPAAAAAAATAAATAEGGISVACEGGRIWLRQLLALVQKNFTVLRRRYALVAVILLSQALAPLLFLAAPAERATAAEAEAFAPVSLAFDGALACEVAHPQECVRVVYAPSSDETVGRVMESFRSVAGLPEDQVRGFSTYLEAERFVAGHAGKVETAAFFHARPDCEAFSQPCVSYTLMRNASAPPSDLSKATGARISTLRFQRALEEASVRALVEPPTAASSVALQVSYGRFSSLDTLAAANETSSPCAAETSEDFANFSGNLRFLILPYAIAAFLFFQLLMEEKEDRLVLGLRRLGLRDSAYHASWFLVALVLSFAGCVLGAGVMKACVSKVTAGIDPVLFFVVTWMYSCALMAEFAFLTSISIFGGEFSLFLVLVTLLTAVLTGVALESSFRAYALFSESASLPARCVQATMSADAPYGATLQAHDLAAFVVYFMPWYHFLRILGAVCSKAQLLDGAAFGWDDMYERPDLLEAQKVRTFPSPNDDLWLMVANVAMYYVLAWFFGQVLSSEAGEARSLAVFLGPLRKFVFKPEAEPLAADVRGNEQKLSREQQSVRCYKLSKTFKNTTAVKELSLQMASGEVFVLLGHNGAGKSTLINMLTCALAPTHGKAYVMGLDVAQDGDALQQVIGVCAQHDHLYKDLTAREHMRLNAKFKGVAVDSRLDAEIDTLLEKVGLLQDADKLARTFSGGMKRRLSVAMSAVGDAKVLFLDEPSTGLDPISKRAVWDCITWLKRDRIVLLTTHSMEEADSLGDTICIMHSGKVKAIGNSLFLKNVYGQGMQVQLVVSPAREEEVSSTIKQIVPGVEFIETEHMVGAASGHMTLRLRKRCLPCMPALFQYIQGNLGEHLIREWGLSNTTLEQVFLQLCAQTEAVNQSHVASSNECVLCGRINDMVLMRTMGGTVFELPDAVCSQCADAPPSVYVQSAADRMRSLEEVTDGAPGPEAKEGAIDARGPRTGSDPAPPVEVAVAQQNPLVPDDGGVQDDAPTAGPEAPRGAPSAPGVLAAPAAPQGAPSAGAARGTATVIRDQIAAVALHNISVQGKNCKVNCCVTCVLVVMLLIFYLLAFFIPVGLGLSICPDGYSVLNGADCSLEEKTSTLFRQYNERHPHVVNATSITAKEDVLNCGAWAPSRPRPLAVWVDSGDIGALWANSTGYLTDRFGEDLPACGPDDCTATPNIQQVYPYWNCPLGRAGRYAVGLPVEFVQRAPSAAGFDEDFLSGQRVVHDSFLEDQSDLFTDATCAVWAPPEGLPPFNATSVDSLARYLADASIECQSCDLDALHMDVELRHLSVSNGRNYPFASTFSYTDPSDPGADESDPTTPDLFGDDCAANVRIGGAFLPKGIVEVTPTWQEAAPFEGENGGDAAMRANTLAASKYVNMVSNTLAMKALNASLPPLHVEDFVDYDALLYISENQLRAWLSTFLLIFCVTALNLLFPLSVWRICYEASLGLSSFMESIGMTRTAYVLGMFLFDFGLFLAARLFVLLLAVLAKLSIFAGAPVGSVIGLSVCGALGSAGFSQLWAIPFRSNHRMASMGAGIAVIGVVIANLILNSTVYASVGSYPAALNFIALLGEARALHLIVTYAEPSGEFNTSCGILVLVGILGLVCGILAGEGALRRAYQLLMAVVTEHSGGARGEVDEEMALTAAGGVLDGDVDAMSRSAAAAVDGRVDEWAVVTHGLRVEYPATSQQGSFVAVKSLDLALRYGETYCLLGPNGAGKTTTINVLNGMQRPTAGRVYVGGIDVRENPTALGNIMGIVPQFEVLWPNLTVEEHLDFYCRVKGIQSSRFRAAEKQRVALAVQLDGDAYHTKAGELSGGMRRRLAIAIAIIGDPRILFLDEMSTGLDPENTRLIWSLLQRLKSPRRLILLTTHSMVEAEALSSAIGIMVRGALRCTGSANDLKARFGSGYNFYINTKSGTDEDAVDDFVDGRLVRGGGGGGAELVGVRNTTRHYRLPESIEISHVFRVMNSQRSAIGVEEWSLNRSTMDDVFVSVVRGS